MNRGLEYVFQLHLYSNNAGIQHLDVHEAMLVLSRALGGKVLPQLDNSYGFSQDYA